MSPFPPPGTCTISAPSRKVGIIIANRDPGLVIARASA